MRLEDQSCKCECSKIVAEMYSDRLNSAHKLSSLVSPELRFSRPTMQSTTAEPHEGSRKSSFRKCSIVDDQLKISRPKVLSRTGSHCGRMSKSIASRRRSSCLSLRAASSVEHRKSISSLDYNDMKLSQDTNKLEYKIMKNGLSRKKVVKYSKGLYPGIVLGHINCVDSPVFVPKNMGWLWNITDEVTGRKPHPDWIPGAVPKYLKSMIKRISLELDGKSIENPLASIPSKKKLSKNKAATNNGHKASHEEFDTKPTLHLHTKKGVYCIKLLPDEDDDYRKEPMIFTVAQNDNERVLSSDSSLEIEFIRPDMNVKYNKIQEIKTQQSMEEQELTEEIQIPKSIIAKKKKNAPKKKM